MDALPERIDKASRGRVKVERAAPAIGPADYVAAVRDGRLDVLALLASNYPTALPILGIGALPGLFRSIDEYRKVTDEILFQTFNSVLQDKYQLFYAAGGSLPGLVVFSRTEIRTPQDLAGKKIRVPDQYTFEHVGAALRATPVRLPGGEIQPALDRGAIDAAMTSPTTGQLDFSKVSKYAAPWPAVSVVPWAIVVNDKAWRGAPSTLQGILRLEFQRLQAEGFEAAIREQRQTQELLRRQLNFVSFSPVETARIVDPKLVDKIYRDWADLNRNAGVDAESILARVQSAKAGTGGGGDPCYYPTCRCTDGSCKRECCK